MASYYYLVATLPTLRFESEAPFSTEEFLTLCKEQLSKKDYELLLTLSKERSDSYRGANPFIVKWREYNRVFYDYLNYSRSQRLKKGEREKPRSTEFSEIERYVSSALHAQTPLEGELILMRSHWRVASELSDGEFFTLKIVLTYLLHLQILERKALFVRHEGNAEFNRLFSNLQSRIKSI